ncbi:hypothetical protein [Methyloligella solikamskensis]|uniref:Uncharacterized protein n=1 Tax=Methyloligella solikamskensis TaxID=1177756 RepID=A0ABW3JCH6_9HYPH
MRNFGIVQQATAALGAIALAFVLTTGAALAEHHFVGKYKTVGNDGSPMTITLMEDGTAKGEHGDEALSGKWKEKKSAAVIDWADGWTTKIKMKGEKFVKSAWKGEKPKDKMKTDDVEKIE